jgi:hypothetical protein
MDLDTRPNLCPKTNMSTDPEVGDKSVLLEKITGLSKENPGLKVDARSTREIQITSPYKKVEPDPKLELLLQIVLLDDDHREILQAVPPVALFSLKKSRPIRNLPLYPEVPKLNPARVTKTDPEEGTLHDPKTPITRDSS